MRYIGKYDPEIGRVVWGEYDTRPSDNKAPYVIEDTMEPVEMVGLPPKYETRPDGSVWRMSDPVVDSKSRRKELLRAHGMIEMGNDVPDLIRRERERRQHERETR